MLVRACLGLTELDVAARHGTAVFADWLTIFLDRVLEWFLHPFSPLEEGTDEWAVANHIAFACHRVFMQLSPTIFREVALRKLFNFVSANTAVNALKVKRGWGACLKKGGVGVCAFGEGVANGLQRAAGTPSPTHSSPHPPPPSRQHVGSIISYAARAYPEETLARFVPHCADAVEAEVASGAGRPLQLSCW